MKMKKLWFIVIVSLVLGLGSIWCLKSLSLAEKLGKLLDNKNYIVVFQNNNELRSTGGFMGSYAAVSVQRLGVREIRIQDIYVPDGQLVGHVDPPAPIQQAFGQGWWKLRDSNWDPDFNIAAEQMAWFFEQGGEKADGIMAINLSLVNKVLEILGEIKLTDYPEKITNKTFYNLAQKYAETGAFPGSTQKGDFLGAAGRGMVGKIKTIGVMGQIRMIRLIYGEYKKGEILVWFKDKGLASSVQGLEWRGDYLYIVESNLGANKANCCIERQVIHEINNTETKLMVKYRNNNLFESPKPPYFWGGNYIDYLRIVLPKQTEIKQVKVDGKELSQLKLDNQFGRQEDRYEIETKDDYIVVGFWAVVPAQKEISVEIFYELPTMNYEHNILVRHQPGMSSFPYKLVVNGKVIMDKNIDRNVVISLGRGSN
ncbi:MAG: hypothetical protein UU93_C0005G0044 [Candidatus Amesbacteria bacterium GW2011_GWA2_42_12]|uniref:Uncharacterized protein n=1 Tax=Candidatus Amesbacteria bacterium GW2011_GWA2_42_12 TaxID=1618356 RepID=A0A0G1AF32_9BACT|nr:MAG: hypothetical protein UU93_C0005G0044 [Candidatus Amesbacteria bacterium GW2011_GWA2_42_12]